MDLIVETYPVDSQRFLRKQKDSFANPVGTTISREIEHVFTGLLQGPRIESIAPFLDRIIRIRAVQEFTPSQAVAFVFLLKKVIRSKFQKEISEQNLSDELTEFEERIDAMAMLSFDLYAKCREKLYEIRANQAGRQVSRLLQKAGLACEIPTWEPPPDEGNHNE